MNQPLQPYWWKPKPEVLRACLITVLGVVAQTIIATDLSRVDDWRTWLTSLAIGILTALAYAIRAQVGPGGIVPDEPPVIGQILPPTPPAALVSPETAPPGEPLGEPLKVYGVTADDLARAVAQLQHEQRVASARKGAATKAANRAARTPPDATGQG